MASAGISSRRKCEQIITEGRVRVNGKVITALGTKADPQKDDIRVNGKKIFPQRKVTLVMNKPKGYITTLSDERGRQTVADLLPEMDVKLKPVGRLDKDTEGVLIFTNDGALAALLTHPSHGVEKVYLVKTIEKVTEKQVKALERGVYLFETQATSQKSRRGKKTSPAKIKILRQGTANLPSIVEITVHEGRKHQIKRMFQAVGLRVKSLTRVRFGTVTVKGMALGECRILSHQQVNRLRSLVEPKTAKQHENTS